MDNVKFFICGDTKPPQRKTGSDACWDIFIPNLSEQFIRDLTSKNAGQPFSYGLLGSLKNEEAEKTGEGLYLYLPPHEDLLIPTYIKTRFPNNMCLRMSNKSGVATKQKFLVGAEIIDSSYEGIIHVHIFNVSNNLRFIEFGQKIAQLLPIYINNEEHEIFYEEGNELFKEMKNTVSSEEFFKDHDDTRKDGGFGSTGIK